jgi:hypothetical protein
MFIPDPNYFHPGSEFFPSRIRIKEYKYFSPKKWFLSSLKYDPDPGSLGQKGTGSRIRNTDSLVYSLVWFRRTWFMGRAAARREAGSRTGRGKPALLTHGQALHAPGIEFVEFVAAFCRICEQNEPYDFLHIVKLDSVRLQLKNHIFFFHH